MYCSAKTKYHQFQSGGPGISCSSSYKWAMDNIEMSDEMLEEYSKKEAQEN